MCKAWTCSDFPDTHGSFLQAGLEALARDNPGLLPAHRFACPVCCAGFAPGWLRPASETEVDRLFTNQGV